MSGSSDPQHSGQTGAPAGRGETQPEKKSFVVRLEKLERPESWSGELTLHGAFQDPFYDVLALVTSDIAPTSPSTLATGAHLQEGLGHGTYLQRHSDTCMTAEADTFSETLRNMQAHVDPEVHAEAFSNPHMDNCGIMEISNHSDSIDSEHSKTLTVEAMNTTSPQTLPLAIGNHPATTNPLEAPAARTAEFDTPSNYAPLPSGPNPITVPSSLPVETEKKYALRSSGRPRFPLHLRKSSRLHRSIEDGGKGRDRGREEEETLEEKIWMVKEDEITVRKIVVKVPRIPVSLSRRQKSYKISSLETVTGTEKTNDGSPEGSEATREPTALLRMKNNGKSVMVMFPPGELPVILKRRRGRPPKQPLPGIQVEVPSAGATGITGDQPKKPRRRRRTKLPCPFPSYVNDTNDVKAEYGDVLSKLAFLNRQPPATGRCSPPRCWTPSEPESFHTPLENPGISTLLHRLTGSRRPRGGRGGGLGRGGGAGGGIMGSECNKSTFSDFFESIGKKRKLNLLSQHGLPRKRRKGVGGGVGRGGGMVGTEPGGEKIVKRRRMRKNGAFKGGVVSMGQDWPNGTGVWDEEGAMDKERALGGYQICGSPRGGFSSCNVGRGGAYSGPAGSKGGGPAGEDSQGLFAGYFRSLLDSDDSSDLLDISSQSDPRKSSSSAYDPSSSAASHSWSPPFPKWSTKGTNAGYHGYSEYGSNESKDILDISNYTPQKAKRQPFPESLSESSSDSSHVGSTAPVIGPSSTGGSYRQNEAASVSAGQSSLSSLEKLMMDWHESASGPSYNWSQDVLFQGGGTNKPGRGRRKRTELHLEKEGGSALHSDSPSSPSPTAAPGPKRGGAGGRGRGSRGGRGGLSSCQRERPTGSKGRGKMASVSGAGLMVSAGGPEGSGLFQEGLDYYSGDSSSLSPLATPNPAPPSSYLQDTCEYPSPYSAHPSTPSSEERYPALYPGESSSSLSPSVSSPPYPPKPTPPPTQPYHLLPSRTFSPSCSPSPRLTPHCGTALSPSHRPPPKDPQFSQYDSPSYCSSPYWYGQTSHSGSPSPHSNTTVHAHSNPHASPHGNAHANSLTNPTVNTHTHMSDTQHQSHTNLSSHTSTHPASHLQSSQPHLNAHLPALAHPNPSPGLLSHSTPGLYEERSPSSAMAPHKRDLVPHSMSTGLRQGPLPHSPYSKPPLDASPHQEDTSGYTLPQQSYQGVGHRYTPQTAQGGGVLCQLLDPASDDSFSVTSL
uniref:AT hook, DNA binding motif, containing 1 n=1 Tax=Xiphophorus couchianus TaxID=32473 RepID=A0A3B5MRE9_9TELE